MILFVEHYSNEQTVKMKNMSEAAWGGGGSATARRCVCLEKDNRMDPCGNGAFCLDNLCHCSGPHAGENY